MTSSADNADLLAAARAWLVEDPDPQTRSELEQLLATVEEGGDLTELADAFRAPLAFGTAGLRGLLGAGPNRMNRVVVTRAAAGLAAHLLGSGAAPGSPVVIGYDARHNSDVFARDTAEVMSGAGLSAHVMPRPLPTPVLAFAIRELGAVAGVMVTASHNPPRDNGYKVYLGDGSQIVSPVDEQISARIAAVGPLAEIPRGDAGTPVAEAVLERYVATASAVVPAGARELRVVYTPMHGVGNDTTIAALRGAGFTDVHVVSDQEQPDPEFPTVAFPNPEEPGAMDLAMALAAQVDADLVVANDPDADRCAAAVPSQHGWRMLRGDEVGALLGDHLLSSGKQGVYAQSIVSSSLLGKLAAAAGQPHQETLTGFKWIGRIPGLAFGYEEALGYCVDPDHVKDKDGVSAAVLLCHVAAQAKAAGRTLVDLLDDIARKHGLHATDQVSARVSDLSLITSAMTRLREQPPIEIGGLEVLRVDDLSRGSGELPPTDGLRYHLADGARVIVRPSGTEPKVKCYLEVVVPVEEGGGVDAARIVAAGRLDALGESIRAAAGL